MHKIYNTHFKYYGKNRVILSFNKNKEEVAATYIDSYDFYYSALGLLVPENKDFLYTNKIMYLIYKELYPTYNFINMPHAR